MSSPSATAGRERRGGESRGRASRRETGFITLDTHLCDACWECVEACPDDVLGRLTVLFHKHARIVAPGSCTGCLRCVKACETGALARRGD
jgi:NAD-dependent dihydropyrimidine dehydrogenase PreA subunit